MEATDKVVPILAHAKKNPFEKPSRSIAINEKRTTLRQAEESDISAIQTLYWKTYEGKYRQEFAINPEALREQVRDRERTLWLVAQDEESREIAGAIVYHCDRINRLAKAVGVVVSPQYRRAGIGSGLLQLGVDYLTKQMRTADVCYATTRTVNEAPSKAVAEVGFQQLGLFPNAALTDNLEHLNLDVYLTPQAIATRRRNPYLVPAFQEIYQIARKKLGFEKAETVTERAPLRLSPKKINLLLIQDEVEAINRFTLLTSEKRISNSFFPFHKPNWILKTEDGGTEVFVWCAGVGQDAAIVGYRTDRVNVHDLLDSVAVALQRAGAAYVELLVDAYNYMLQQEALTARFIPSAYFPAMKLNHDGLRDDYFVLSRTFRLLDFSGSVMAGDNLKFLKAYLRFYHELYIKPILA